MKSGIKKAAPGKTMRVAAVFTGAAACAAAFTPAAVAGAGHQPGLDGKTITAHRPHGKTPGIRPYISGTVSCSTVPRWVHLKSLNGHTLCFGFDGKSSINFSWHNFTYFTSICGGNNSGYVVNESGRATFFRPGNTYVHLPWPGQTELHDIVITNSRPAGDHHC